jgi:hypothetical protein
MTKIRVSDLREAYEEAVIEGRSEFQFKGMLFLTGFAKYLLQYLEQIQKLGPNDFVEVDPMDNAKAQGIYTAG